MEMDSLVNLILNSSVSIVVIAYFMFRDYKFIQQLNVNIQKLMDVILMNNNKIDTLKKEVSQYGTKSR